MEDLAPIVPQPSVIRADQQEKMHNNYWSQQVLSQSINLRTQTIFFFFPDISITHPASHNLIVVTC